MNARHTYLISTLVAVVLLTFGASAALAERHDQSKRSGKAPSHAAQAHAGQVRANQVHVNPVRDNPSHANPSHVGQVHAGHSGQGRSHASQVHATHLVRGNLAHSSVHPVHPGYQVHRAEAAYRHSYPIYPVHRYPSAVVVARPFVVYPPVVYDTTCIRIVNPAELGVAVSYTLDGQQVFLQPGEVQTLYRRCLITFDRGNGYGYTQLVLTGGTYTFGVAYDGGWILVRT
jgi:hypothetical protein